MLTVARPVDLHRGMFLLRAGVPMPVVSRILGQSSIGITVDTYGHVVMDDQVKDAMDKVLRAWTR